jgi:hypothetical protein
MCIIHIHNAISLAKDKQKMSYLEVLPTIVLILQLKKLPKCKQATTKIQLWNWDHLATIYSNIEHISHPCVHGQYPLE